MSKDIVIENFLSNEDLLQCQYYFKNSNEIIDDVLINDKKFSIAKHNFIKFDASYTIESFDVEDKFILDLYNNYNTMLLNQIDDSIYKHYDNIEINLNETKKQLIYKINRADDNVLTAIISVIDTNVHDPLLEKASKSIENRCVVTINEINKADRIKNMFRV